MFFDPVDVFTFSKWTQTSKLEVMEAKGFGATPKLLLGNNEFYAMVNFPWWLGDKTEHF